MTSLIMVLKMIYNFHRRKPELDEFIADFNERCTHLSFLINWPLDTLLDVLHLKFGGPKNISYLKILAWLSFHINIQGSAPFTEKMKTSILSKDDLIKNPQIRLLKVENSQRITAVYLKKKLDSIERFDSKNKYHGQIETFYNLLNADSTAHRSSRIARHISRLELEILKENLVAREVPRGFNFCD